MERFLMTQSLLSSWSWIYSCYEGYEDEAVESFMRTLRREPSERTEAMQGGINFENEVYKRLLGKPYEPHPEWEQGIAAAAEILNGAVTQVKAYCDIEVDGTKFLLYGILDALKCGVIYDIKFSTKPIATNYEYGKYADNAQHPAYLRLIPEAYEFTYITSDGVDCYRETYRREETRPVEQIIREFISSVDRMGYLPIYKEKWLA